MENVGAGAETPNRPEWDPRLTETEAREFLPRLQAMWLSADAEHWARMCCHDVLLVSRSRRRFAGGRMRVGASNGCFVTCKARG